MLAARQMCVASDAASSANLGQESPDEYWDASFEQSRPPARAGGRLVNGRPYGLRLGDSVDPSPSTR
jgi:hypothetical protein